MATSSEQDPELSQILDGSIDMLETYGFPYQYDRHHSNHHQQQSHHNHSFHHQQQITTVTSSSHSSHHARSREQRDKLAISKIAQSLMQLDQAYSGSPLLAHLGPLQGSTGGVSPGGASMATTATLFINNSMVPNMSDGFNNHVPILSSNNNNSSAAASNQQQGGGGGGFLMPPHYGLQRTVAQQQQQQQQRHDYRRMIIVHNVRQLQQQTNSVAVLPSSMEGGGGNNINHINHIRVQSPLDTMAQWKYGEVPSSEGVAEVTVISDGGGGIGPQTVIAGQHAARLGSLDSGGGDVSTNLSNHQQQQCLLHHHVQLHGRGRC